MALTATEQEIFDFAVAMLPDWFTGNPRGYEFLGAMAKMVGAEQTQADYWQDRTFIGIADGPVGDLPDWLNQHAIGRNTRRQSSETDPALRARITNVQDSLTRPVLLAAAQAIVDADGIVGTVAMVELARDAAFFQTAVADTGTGGVFTAPDGDGNQTFLPDVAFAGPPFRAPEEEVNHKLVISGAADPNNDGTLPVIALVGDAAQYLNAGGGASTDATCTWTVNKYDRDDNLLSGFDDAYFDRGDRMSSGRSVIIIILPFGSTAGTKASVDEMLRLNGAAGMRRFAEYRQIP